MVHTIHTKGFVKAIADQSHPFQTRLSLIITDFEPNGNHQGIPKAEAENIIRTALNQPLKINFTGDGYLGHTGAFPVGPITRVFTSNDNGRDIIAGEAVIWNELYRDVAEHLTSTLQNGVGTSWEIYFEDTEKDDNGTEWLKNCTFAATCVVETPAYGPNRTRILAIAEKMRDIIDTEVIMSKTADINNSANSAADVETVRNELLNTQDLMFKLWEGIDTLFTQTFEIEEASVEKDIGKIAAQFAEKLGKIADTIKNLKEKAGLAEQLQSEVSTLKEEKSSNERAQLIKDRTQRLSEAGLDITADTFQEKLLMYTDMTDVVFNTYIADLTAVRKTPAQAEHKKVIIPEPISSDNDYSIKDIAKAYLEQNRG